MRFCDRSLALALLIGVLLLSEAVGATPTQFSTSITQQPAATSQDATRAAANRTAKEGLQLYLQGTAESKRQAIAKLEEALSLYRAVGDKSWEATILFSLGSVYDDLGEKHNALDYYNQSLPIRDKLRLYGSGQEVLARIPEKKLVRASLLFRKGSNN